MKFANMIGSAVVVTGMALSTGAFAAPTDLTGCSGTTDGGVAWDISGSVVANTGCLIDWANDQDNVAGGNANFLNFTVNDGDGGGNANGYFGFTDWLFDGKGFDNPAPAIVSFSGDVLSGSWEVLNDFTGQLMFVFKDGNETQLVAYLVSGMSGTYTSPFLNPPFDFTGNPPRDISHISVYYRDGFDFDVPEPATLGLLGLGLVGFGLARRRRS